MAPTPQRAASRPPPPPPGSALRGLDDQVAARPAGEVLNEVSWAGAEVNPDAISAADFLALL